MNTRHFTFGPDGYAIGYSSVSGNGAIECCMPDAFDDEWFFCYRLGEEGLVFDSERKTEMLAFQCADEIRCKRNDLLRNSDMFMLSDYPITESKRNEWKVYRQALRDVTKQPGFPHNVIWPEKPGT